MDPLIRTFTIPELDRGGLRRFGITIGAIVAGLFGLLLPWIFKHGLPTWPWVLGGGLVAWGIVAPASLRPVYRGWMRLAHLISRVTTPIVLGVVFLLFIVPTALILRLANRDPMARRLDPDQASYRLPARQAPATHMEKPY